VDLENKRNQRHHSQQQGGPRSNGTRVLRARLILVCNHDDVVSVRGEHRSGSDGSARLRGRDHRVGRSERWLHHLRRRRRRRQAGALRRRGSRSGHRSRRGRGRRRRSHRGLALTINQRLSRRTSHAHTTLQVGQGGRAAQAGVGISASHAVRRASTAHIAIHILRARARSHTLRSTKEGEITSTRSAENRRTRALSAVHITRTAHTIAHKGSTGALGTASRAHQHRQAGRTSETVVSCDRASGTSRVTSTAHTILVEVARGTQPSRHHPTSRASIPSTTSSCWQRGCRWHTRSCRTDKCWWNQRTCPQGKQPNNGCHSSRESHCRRSNSCPQ